MSGIDLAKIRERDILSPIVFDELQNTWKKSSKYKLLIIY